MAALDRRSAAQEGVASGWHMETTPLVESGGAFEELACDADALPPDAASWAFNLSAVLVASEEIGVATHVAVQASWAALKAWTQVLRLLSQPLARLAVVTWPSVRSGLAQAALRFAAQSRTALALEGLAFLVFLGLWRLTMLVRRRRYVSRARAAVERKLQRFTACVRHRSQLLAAALPHIAFAFVCYVCSHIIGRLGMRSRGLDFVQSIEPVFSTALPAVRTFLHQSAAPTEHRLFLQYWVVWATVEMFRDLLHAVPFFMRAAVPLYERWWPWHELPFCCYLWLNSSRGRLAAYQFIAPKLQQHADRIGGLLPSVPERLRDAVAVFVLPSILGRERSTALLEVLAEGRMLLLGFFFVLTPSQVAAFGLPLLALGVPALQSIDAVASGTADTTGQMRYWLCYALFWGVLRAFEPVLRWVPFATNMKLLFVLWLQLPIFRAATRLVRLLLPAGIRQQTRAAQPTLGKPCL